MPKNVVITPLSGLVDFYDLNSNLDAKIQIDDAGSLSITNTGGTLSLGNTAANVVIGDGTNSVDMIFEQNGAIRGTTGRTLTLGSVGSNVAVQSPITINSPLLNTSTTGDFEVRQTVSSWTSSTSHPIIKWSFNATYDDNLYLASGGNAGGTSQTALVVTENAGVVIGAGPSSPNSSSIVSTEWFRFDNSRFTISRNAGQYLTFENSDTTTNPIIISYTATNNAKSILFDSRTDPAGTAPTGGVLGYEFRVNGTSALTVNTDRTITTNTNLSVGGTLSVTGNLTINGTTTTVNSTTVTVDDPIFTLGGDTAPTVDDNKDRGIEFRWHNGTTAKVGFFGYDDSTGYLTFIPDATNTSEVFSGTQGDIQATNFRGALIGNSSTATAWQTARTLTIGATGKSVDGSGNVSWTRNEVIGSPPGSGAWYSNSPPNVGPDGVLDIGRYIDFHSSNTGTTDFDVRMDCTASGAITFGSTTVTASTFSGALSGNATTATTLQTSRTITIGATGRSFNGGGNVSWTLTEIMPTTTDLQINSLGVGTAASATAGEIRATNNITAYFSDDRLKTKLGTIKDSLEALKSLEGFFYEPNEVAQNFGYQKVRDVGVSAQSVQKVLPEIVVPAPINENYLTVRYEKLIPLLIEAIKELDLKLTNYIKEQDGTE